MASTKDTAWKLELASGRGKLQHNEKVKYAAMLCWVYLMLRWWPSNHQDLMNQLLLLWLHTRPAWLLDATSAIARCATIWRGTKSRYFMILCSYLKLATGDM